MALSGAFGTGACSKAEGEQGAGRDAPEGRRAAVVPGPTAPSRCVCQQASLLAIAPRPSPLFQEDESILKQVDITVPPI